MEPVPILIVGVDIGMSTSGISCCLLQPGATNPCQPTSIRLHGNTHELEPTELGVKSQTYGSDIGANETRLTLLKLSMTDPKDCPWVLKDLESHDRGMIQRELNRIMTLYPETDAITEYINRLWVDGSQGVRKYLSTFNDLQPSGVEARFVFGVPAIWKQQTIREMRKAIGKSGILAFGRRQPAALDFVQEPEAAAMAVIPGVAQGRGLDVGNTILILDCGGGTVDTVVYEISSLKPVAVNEWVSPEGRFLGAIFMKSAFSSFVRGKVENQMGGDYQSVNQTALDSEIEVAWTAVEEGTIEDLTEEGVFGILSVQRTDGTYAQSVTLQKHDTHKALQTFAGRIVDFAEKQVLAADDQVTLIIVVGGFGRNAVVQDELKRRFGHELLFFTEDAGKTSVKNGACLEGMARIQNDVHDNLDDQDQDQGADDHDLDQGAYGHDLDQGADDHDLDQGAYGHDLDQGADDHDLDQGAYGHDLDQGADDHDLDQGAYGHDLDQGADDHDLDQGADDHDLDQGADDQDHLVQQDGVPMDMRKKARASYGYRPDARSSEIHWFIRKDDMISKSKMSPTYLAFPPQAAFRRTRGPAQFPLAMTIYKTIYKMGGPLNYPADDDNVSPIRVIKCSDPALLDNNMEWEIAAHIHGTSVEFGVSIGQQPCRSRDFTVIKVRR